jgi:hypothetical protein
VSENNVPTLHQFAQRLKSDELGRLLFDFAFGGDLNQRNAVSRLLLKSNRFLPIDEEVEFIAFRLEEIEGLGRLPPSLLEIVLESSSLRIESEDWLLDLIWGLGNEYESLIRCIRCEFLSRRGIEKFIEAITLDRIDSVLWNSVCCRLRNTCSSLSDPVRTGLRTLCFPHGTSDFEGILHHLCVECEGNPHTKGLIAIRASTSHPSQPSVETIADFGQPSRWESLNRANSWVMFDFKELTVSVDGYSLRSRFQLSTWVMEVSDNRGLWSKIDEQSTSELTNVNATKYFACHSRSPQFHRYVRIRQTGVNGHGTDHLLISNLEFYGRLR